MAGADLANQLSMVIPMAQGHVYMLASKRNGTLYVGVTNDLPARIYAHKIGKGSAFTRKYGVTMLVWSESYDLVVDAIQRETSTKRWPRRWKLALIEKDNPDWTDLAETML